MTGQGNSGIKPKHQRLVLLVIALVALVGAGLLAAWALRSQASYFYLPSEIVAEAPAPDQGVRLGGMVEAGSIQTAEDGITVNFIVGDGEARVPVSFTGIVPALFVEGSGVVAEGRMGADGTFVADNLLAKHDENYMPRELEGMSTEEVRAQVEATLE
ncbi:cytochrome c maturation protein CcmE [Alteraurantiacibacter aquimixticola]|uniref:Cytochrome c-type biogenesis protein CcmE n=1 Tax=Alteraurantiacibacter aquimixticola TaxID=2489173 RepID=A0A4T3F536_9SPHN|nr:cytochrome c maturation protein CcmE [Alteraurantiacibacter aquimixticola]TIX51951.1 cytochrome c maturation protein CcmE [Alteraurantiacibacter aquimixticola]